MVTIFYPYLYEFKMVLVLLLLKIKLWRRTYYIKSDLVDYYRTKFSEYIKTSQVLPPKDKDANLFL